MEVGEDDGSGVIGRHNCKINQIAVKKRNHVLENREEPQSPRTEETSQSDEIRDRLEDLKQQNADFEEKLAGILRQRQELEIENDRLTYENLRYSKGLNDREACDKQNPGGVNRHEASTISNAAEHVTKGQAATNAEPVQKTVYNNGVKYILLATYESLTRKYNTIYQRHVEANSAMKDMQKKILDQKKKERHWKRYCEEVEAQSAKKSERILRLEEELRALGARDTPNFDTLDHQPAVPRPLASSFTSISTLAHPIDGISLAKPQEAAAHSTTAQRPQSQPRNPPSPSDRPEKVQTSSTKDHKDKAKDNVVLEDQSVTKSRPNGDVGVEKVLLDMELVESIPDTQFEPIEHQPSSPENNDRVELPQALEMDQQQVCNQIHSNSLPSSDDYPVFVSERSVRKRKRPGSCAKAATSTVRIKSEICSSSPINLSALEGSEGNESIDLDDIGEKQPTPRKPRPVRPRVTNIHRSAQIVQRTPTHQMLLDRKSTALQPMSPNKRILPRTSVTKPSKKRRLVSDGAINDLAEDGQLVTIDKMAIAKLTSPAVTAKLGILLQNPSPPMRAIRSPVALSRIKQANNQVTSIESCKRELAEDEEINNPLVHDERPAPEIGLTPGVPKRRQLGSERRVHTPRNSADLPENSHNSKLKGPCRTLPALPNSPHTPASTSVTNQNLASTFMSHRGAGTTKTKVTEVGHHSLPNVRVRPRLENNNTVAKRRSDTLREIFNAEIDHPDNEPLRARPLATLTPDHFKINPAYNQGRDFAFREVVRSKERRRCLPGCTRPECCGTGFRALAEESVDHPTLSQEEKDQKILEEYLGDNVYKLRNMTNAERREALIVAKTRDLANRHGKHRHAYERPASPPGFWRMDFPNTQEQIEDRQKAAQLQREQVERRYHEAMRKGGAYVFRDE